MSRIILTAYGPKGAPAMFYIVSAENGVYNHVTGHYDMLATPMGTFTADRYEDACNLKTILEGVIAGTSFVEEVDDG